MTPMPTQPMADLEIGILDRITAALAELPEDQHFQFLCNSLQSAFDVDEQVVDMTMECWSLLTKEHMWSNHFRTLDAFKEAIGFEDFVAPVLARVPNTQLRKLRYRRKIRTNWGHEVEVVLEGLLPKQVGTYVYMTLASLSAKVDAETGRVLLQAKVDERREIAKRRGKSGRVTSHTIGGSDVTACLQDIRQLNIDAAQPTGTYHTTHKCIEN